MGLHARWTAEDDTKIPTHDWFGLLHVWLTDAEGLGSAAGALAVSTWSLDAGEQAEANAIKAKYDALGTAVEKVEFVSRIHAAVMLSESGIISEAQAKTLLGF